MTYFVGIDPASESFVASVYTTPDTTPDGPSLSPHSFSNDPEGFEAFTDWVDEAFIPKEAVLVLIVGYLVGTLTRMLATAAAIALYACAAHGS